MIILDTHIVLGAQRSDHPQHSVAKAWLEALIDGDEQFGVPSTVWASLLRLTTNARVFVIPTPPGDAFAVIEAVVTTRNHVPCEPGPRHLSILAAVCEESEATGDLVPDAVLSTLAREHGAAVASFDRDFARFVGLRRVRP